MERLKLIAMTMMCMMCALSFSACDDDDDDGKQGGNGRPNVPEAVTTAFSAQYPGMNIAEWDFERGQYYVAEFYKDGYEYDAWYATDGTWVRTEIDYGKDLTALPQAVQTAYAATEYAATWRIDDIEEIQLPALDTVYIIEVEKAGQADVRLGFLADGTACQPVATW